MIFGVARFLKGFSTFQRLTVTAPNIPPLGTATHVESAIVPPFRFLARNLRKQTTRVRHARDSVASCYSYVRRLCPSFVISEPDSCRVYCPGPGTRHPASNCDHWGTNRNRSDRSVDERRSVKVVKRKSDGAHGKGERAKTGSSGWTHPLTAPACPALALLKSSRRAYGSLTRVRHSLVLSIGLAWRVSQFYDCTRPP